MSDLRQDDLEAQLKTLLLAKYPSFIFIRDLSSADVSVSTLKTILPVLGSKSEKLVFSFVNSVACFTQRLLFDSILNGLLSSCLASHVDANCDTLPSQKNDSVDDFLHNIRLLFPMAAIDCPCSSTNSVQDPLKIVIVLEKSEKLKDALPRLIYPLSRLQELTRLNITTIFISEDAWENLTLVPGTLLDPYSMEVGRLDRKEIIERICNTFPKGPSPDSVSMYNPSLEMLFQHFVEAVYDICSPFVSDPTELGYIVAARWPGFVAPVLEDWKEQEQGPYFAPAEDVRIRLTRLFNPSLMNAVECLYPRTMERKEWSAANSFPEHFRLSRARNAQLPSSTTSTNDAADSISRLSVLSIFIVLAAFLASYNPAKTDYRMFGRGADEKSRRRRKGGGTRKTKAGTVPKLSQRLVGPMSFSYDRLAAILGSLLREYGDSKQMGQSLEDVSELKVEVDVYRVQTSASIRELVSQQLLYRTAAQENLEGLSFRCGIGYDQALLLARKLGIPLNDLMWEPH